MGFADRLLLNKVDLVDKVDLERVENRLRAINAFAPIQRCTRSQVSVDSVLNIHGFDLERTLSQLPGLCCPHTLPPRSSAYYRLPPRTSYGGRLTRCVILGPFADFLTTTATTKHDSSVTSVSLSQGAARHLRKVQQGPLDMILLQEWLSELLRVRGGDIFRIKGVLSIACADAKFVCQAVHMIYSAEFDEPWAPDEARLSKLVFIGKGLDAAELADSFNRCLASPANLARRKAALRFAVGEEVEFFGGAEDGWVDATVTNHLVWEDDMPPGLVAPYEIQRHDDPPGYVTWAERDDDSWVRRKGASGGKGAAGGSSVAKAAEDAPVASSSSGDRPHEPKPEADHQRSKLPRLS